MSALGAAMRKLVQICFGVLKHQTPYRLEWPERRLSGCEGDGIYTHSRTGVTTL